jgi:hypothetical protein
MGSAVAGAPYDLVALDDVEAGALAVSRLLDLEHRTVRLNRWGFQRG